MCICWSFIFYIKSGCSGLLVDYDGVTYLLLVQILNFVRSPLMLVA